jgi:hypothetical protein
MAFLITDILLISPEFLRYSDTNGHEQVIDLRKCAYYWVTRLNINIGDYIKLDGTPAEKKDPEKNKIVGDRNWFEEKPFYRLEYAVDQFITFEIRPQKKWHDYFRKHWHQRYYSQFRLIEEQFNKSGWSTYDLG